MQKTIIVGGGLTGSLLSIFLAKRGFQVEVYEKRPDLRQTDAQEGRSINLALSSRGIRALKAADIAEEALKHAIPMYGRTLHDIKGDLTHLPYGKDQSEYINSISRSGLNEVLLTEAEKYENVHVFFEEICEDVSFSDNSLTIINMQSGEKRNITGDVIIATDGAGSVVRQKMMALEGFEQQVEFIEHGYRELEIPPSASGGFSMEQNALHIWPRGEYMLIALPNPGGSFTATLFLANKGPLSFENLNTPQKAKQFFSEYFTDVLALMPSFEKDYLNNPVGALGTVKCGPWHANNGKFLLLGDAAHAIVPFYGQGMNASFEDCLLLDQFIERFEADWKKVFSEFYKRRKKDTDAIAELALENFYEMRDASANPIFQKMRKLEYLLENAFEDYHSKYSMVTFHPEIPYSMAQRKGNLQNEFLLKLCSSVDEDLNKINLTQLRDQMQTLLNF